MELEMVQPLSQFGVAGLMGVLWVWERLLSRKREAQLDATQAKLSQRDDQWNVLLDAVRRNTEAMERSAQVQLQLRDLLERMNHAASQRA